MLYLAFLGSWMVNVVVLVAHGSKLCRFIMASLVRKYVLVVVLIKAATSEQQEQAGNKQGQQE